MVASILLDSSPSRRFTLLDSSSSWGDGQFLIGGGPNIGKGSDFYESN